MRQLLFIGGRASWKKMDRDTRPLLTMYGALHLKLNLSEIYLPRDMGKRRFTGVKEYVDGEESSIAPYTIKSTAKAT